MSKWKRVFIPEVLFFQEGPGVRNTQYKKSGVKLLNVANLQDGKIDLSTSARYISEEEAYSRYKHFLVQEGDLIIASSGIKVEYFDKKMGFVKKEHLPLCMNTSTIRFRTLDEEQLLLNYFMYYLKTNNFKKKLGKMITGSAQLNFGPSHLKKMTLPLPPLETQKQIAKTLDAASELLSMRKQQLAELDNLIKSVFYDMFGDPVTNEKGWDIKKLSEIGAIDRGVSKHRPRNDPSLLGGQYPLIQTGDVSNADFIIRKYKQTYSDKGLSQSRIWKAGTLCITIAANIAKTAIMGFNACFPDSVVGFNANEHTNNIFVLCWFSFFQKILEAQAPESAQKNINLRILNELNVILPPIVLQNKFASIVTKIEAQKSLVKKSIEESQLLFDSLMSQYFD